MVTPNSNSLHDLHDLVSEKPFPCISLFGVEAEITISDMGKSETEHDKIMRRSKKIIYQRLSINITLNICTAHYNKGK